MKIKFLRFFEAAFLITLIKAACIGACSSDADCNDGTCQVPDGGGAKECFDNCGYLLVYYAVLNDSSTIYGTVVSVTCYDGYKLEGDSLFVCQANGTWRGNSTCTQIDCGPLELPNGRYNSTCTTYGSVVAGYCNEGYDYVGDDVIECLENGMWSGTAQCVEKVPAKRHCITLPLHKYRGLRDCNSLTLESGQYNGSDTVYAPGTLLQGTCNPGYNLEGNRYRTCLTYGLWSGWTECDIIECSDLEVWYAQLNTSATTYGTVVAVTCDPGYKQIGESVLTCTSVGKWTGSSKCKLVECPPLNSPDTQYNTTCTVYGTVVTADCDVGYYLEGGPTIKCLADGTWSDTLTCKAVGCPNLTTPNAVYDTNSTTFGTVVTGSCEIGYELTSGSTIQCLANGTWNGTVTCTIVECPPLNATHITYDNSSTTYGTVVSGNCDLGYELVGRSIECLADGTWNGTLTCQNIRCPNLTTPNVVYDTNSTTFGTVATGYCETGYELTSGSTIQCLANGTWNDTITCNIIGCPDLTTTNVVYDTNSTTFGTVVTGSCEIGYELTSGSTIQCLTNGTWNGTITCNIIVCPNLTTPNVVYDTNSTTFGTTATGSCEIGYEPTGGYTIECLANGTWNDTVTCKIIGASTIQCLANGTWNDTITCKIIDCGPLTLANGYFDVNLTTYGTKANAYCNTGFLLTGANVRECQSNGSWSGETKCEVDNTCTCPDSFEEFGDGYCYVALPETSLTFLEAVDYCVNEWSGVLATAKTPEVNEFFKYMIWMVPDYFGYKVFWTGLIDWDFDTEFVWYDTLVNVGYTDWTIYYFGNQNCATYESFYGWSRDDCDNRYSVICKVPCASASQGPTN